MFMFARFCRSFIYLVHAPKMGTPEKGTSGLLPLLKKLVYPSLRSFSQISEESSGDEDASRAATRRSRIRCILSTVALGTLSAVAIGYLLLLS